MVRSWMSVVFAIFLVFTATACFSQNSPPQSPAPTTPAASSAPSTASTAPPAEEEDDDSPDIPPFARSRTSSKEYLQLRDQQLRLQRGLDDLLRDPQARGRALRSMQLQEQSLRRMQTRSAVSGAGPLVSPTWTALGPSPIPNGQTSPTSVAVSGRVTAIAI